MGQLRIDKIEKFLKQEISKIILTELKDTGIGFITVIGVEVTTDLHYAKIYISLFGDNASKKATWEGLKRATGYIRSAISKRICLRSAPKISFHLDKTLEYSSNIEKLLLDIKRKN